MANARSANTYWVDTTSSSGDVTSFVTAKGIVVTDITFQVNATTDSIVVSDLGSDGASAGTTKFKLMAGTAKDTRQLRYADCPKVFPNGAWFVVTGSPTATFTFEVKQGSGS